MSLVDTLIQHADFLINARGSVSDATALVAVATENQTQRADAWGWNHPSIKLGATVSTVLDDLDRAVKNGWISPDAPLEFFSSMWRADIQQELKTFAAHCAQPTSS